MLITSEKLKMALKLDELGVDVIEAGSTITSKEEQKNIKTITENSGIKKQGNITVIYINTITEQMQKTEKLLGTRKDELLESYDPEK